MSTSISRRNVNQLSDNNPSGMEGEGADSRQGTLNSKDIRSGFPMDRFGLKVTIWLIFITCLADEVENITVRLLHYLSIFIPCDVTVYNMNIKT